MSVPINIRPAAGMAIPVEVEADDV